MSELKRVIEQCDACGRFRYPNDLIAYDCHGCGEWAEKQIIALRAEVAALKAECAEAWRVHSEVVAELKAKLAKYTEPLTDEQARRACAIVARESGVYVADPAHEWDAAIRVARLEVR